MADNKALSPEETFVLINTKAKEQGDTFRVKVYRRRPGSTLLETVATLGDAKVEHIANPEMWLQQLAGGGPTFVLQVFHTSEPTTAVGGMFAINIPGDPRDVDLRVVKHPGWAGPPALLFPQASLMPQAPGVGAGGDPMYAVGAGGGATAYGAYGAQQFAYPNGNGTRPPLPPGYGYDPYYPPRTTPDPAQAAQIASLTQQTAQLRDALAQRERDLAEERRRGELEQAKRESDKQIAELRAQVAALAAVKSMPTAEPAGASIERIMVALAPILTPLLQGQQAMRLEMLKLEAAGRAENQQLLHQMMNRPPLDPTVERLFTQLREIQATAGKPDTSAQQMVAHMASAMGTMSKITMDLVATAADIGLGGRGPDESPAVKIMKEASRGLQALMQGYQASVQERVQPGLIPPFSQPGLPAASVPAPGYADAARAAVPAAAPAAVPASVSSTPPPVAQSAQPAQPHIPTGLDRLKDQIFNGHMVGTVAATLIQAIKAGDKSVTDGLIAHDGDVAQFAAQHVGQWAMQDKSGARAQYLRDLLDEVESQGETAGIWDDQQGEGGGDAGPVVEGSTVPVTPAPIAAAPAAPVPALAVVPAPVP